MDHRLAARAISGGNSGIFGNLTRQSVDSFLSLPLGDGVSERGSAANGALRAEVGAVGAVGAVVRERAAAYQLIARMACVYQTMHGELAPADRL
jgi:hypothetical protein